MSWFQQWLRKSTEGENFVEVGAGNTYRAWGFRSAFGCWLLAPNAWELGVGGLPSSFLSYSPISWRTGFWITKMFLVQLWRSPRISVSYHIYDQPGLWYRIHREGSALLGVRVNPISDTKVNDGVDWRGT